jgi:mRNA-degrading endonuclease toxin of MazEF toxin-antitoxin module
MSPSWVFDLHALAIAKPGSLSDLAREPDGQVLSPPLNSAAFTENTGLAIVCPITSRVRPFPTSVVLPPGLPIAGEILISHIRSIDTMARPVRYAGVAVPSGSRTTRPREAQHLHNDPRDRILPNKSLPTGNRPVQFDLKSC